eukprot:scaffold803_cov310-Pinguiococcus_pyrenoidosus.AAC.98
MSGREGRNGSSFTLYFAARRIACGWNGASWAARSSRHWYPGFSATQRTSGAPRFRADGTQSYAAQAEDSRSWPIKSSYGVAWELRIACMAPAGGRACFQLRRAAAYYGGNEIDRFKNSSMHLYTSQ